MRLDAGIQLESALPVGCEITKGPLVIFPLSSVAPRGGEKEGISPVDLASRYELFALKKAGHRQVDLSTGKILRIHCALQR
jgi:hypothetical protein